MPFLDFIETVYEHPHYAIGMLTSAFAYFFYRIVIAILHHGETSENKEAQSEQRNDNQVDRLIGIAERAINEFSGGLSDLLSQLVSVETSNATRLARIEGGVNQLPKAVTEAILPELEKLRGHITQVETTILERIESSVSLEPQENEVENRRPLE